MVTQRTRLFDWPHAWQRVLMCSCAVSRAMSAPTIDAKKDEFRAYLERGGVVDALTKGKLECGRALAVHFI